MLKFIIKTVERCNINCSYCYFFNKTDQSYQSHPPYISRETIDNIAFFINEGIKDLNDEYVGIVFHGGEPLMQDKSDFDYMCQTLKEKTQCKQLDFSLQTNLMLLDSDWISLFKKYNVSVCLSIDGPKEVHDLNRKDKRGRGTFDRTVEKLKFFLDESDRICALSVINPTFDPVKIFKFFYDDLKLKQVDFLMPDAHHDDRPIYTNNEISDFYLSIHSYMVENNIKDFKLRFLNNIIGSFFGKKPLVYGHGSSDKLITHPITISSGGDISPVDDLRNTKNTIMYSNKNVLNTKYKNFIQSEIFSSINSALENIPEQCNDCCWKNLCRGGNLVHRYSKSNDFKNKSIYCKALKNIYGSVASRLLLKGFSLPQMEKVLGLN